MLRSALRWPYTFAVTLSVAIGVLAIVSAQVLDLPMKDPEGFLGPAYVRLPLIGFLFFALGVVPPMVKRGGGITRWPANAVQVVRDEWTWGRFVNIATGLITFYVCYVSYRNLKSYLPVVREDVLFDRDLLQLDHWLAFGNQPGELLHALLGTGWVAQVLATFYVSYLALIPITLGAVLVWHKDFTVGAWYATAISLNWVLGTASYYSLPTLGPAFAQPQSFRDLPVNAATELQSSLFRNGAWFKADPHGGSIYGIAGFASLHVSVVVTALLFFYRAGFGRAIVGAAGAFLLATVLATIYFGWHYVADDVAGALIGWLAVVIGAWVTGNGRTRRRDFLRRKKAVPAAEPVS